MKHTSPILRIGILLALLLAAVPAQASTTATGLPWETPLNTIRDSLTGPIAVSLGAIAFFVAGGMLIFGGEIGDFTKRVMYAVLSAAVMLLGGSIISTLFPGSTLI